MEKSFFGSEFKTTPERVFVYPEDVPLDGGPPEGGFQFGDIFLQEGRCFVWGSTKWEPLLTQGHEYGLDWATFFLEKDRPIIVRQEEVGGVTTREFWLV